MGLLIFIAVEQRRPMTDCLTTGISHSSRLLSEAHTMPLIDNPASRGTSFVNIKVMSLTARYHCPVCPSCASDNFLPVLRHIGAVHSFDARFSITCGINGCQATYKKFASYKTHIYRKHRDSEAVRLVTQRPGDDDDDNVNQLPAETDAEERAVFEQADVEQVQTEKRESTAACAAKFILSMKEGLCLTQQACDHLVSGVSELFDSLLSHLHEGVKTSCDSAENIREAIDEAFHNELNTEPFASLSTRHYQLKYFREKFGLLVLLLVS